MATAIAASADLDAYVRRIVAIHFDPRDGAAYWIEKAQALNIDARAQLTSFDALAALGPMDEDALRTRSVLDFVPASRHSHLAGAIRAETGGATGQPKRTLFTRAEFHAAFVAPFVTAAEIAHFPRGGNWLWAGPSGPHIIGQAAAACAQALGSPQPFAIDFDPRWFRRLTPESTGRLRYLQHLVDQALAIVAAEPIDVIFTTPVLLARLAEAMTAAQRQRIRGVHYGGMRVEADLLARAQHDWFPNAVHLAGYGNSLFGLCMEFGGQPDRILRYYPLGLRHQVRVDADNRVWMSRLDETIFIPNLPERDRAEAADLPQALADLGYQPGVAAPGPRATPEKVPDLGIY